MLNVKINNFQGIIKLAVEIKIEHVKVTVIMTDTEMMRVSLSLMDA